MKILIKKIILIIANINIMKIKIIIIIQVKAIKLIKKEKMKTLIFLKIVPKIQIQINQI